MSRLYSCLAARYRQGIVSYFRRLTLSSFLTEPLCPRDSFFRTPPSITLDSFRRSAHRPELEGELMAQQAALDTMIVKRIQEACAAERADRAMDLASLLHLEKSYSIAIKVY